MLHERCLRIIYNDQQPSLTELLNKYNSVSVHIRNIQRLAIEMFRFYNGLSPSLMSNMFKLKAENSYKSRQYYGTGSISYLGHKNMGYISRKTEEHWQPIVF